MKECELNKLSSSPSLAVVRKNNVNRPTVFNNFFCYIVQTFFTFRSAKKLDDDDEKMRRRNKTALEVTAAVGKLADGKESVQKIENTTRKFPRCRLPVLIRRKKLKSGTELESVTAIKNVTPVSAVSIESSQMKSSADFLPQVTEQCSILSVSKSLSCHLLVEPKSKKTKTPVIPKRTSEQCIQAVPPIRRVKIDLKPSKKLLSQSKEIQVGGRNIGLELFTSQVEIIPPTHGDSLQPSPPTKRPSNTSNSSLPLKPVQRKRTYPSVNPPLLRNKAVTAAAVAPKKDIRPPGPLNEDATKSLTLPSTLINTVVELPKIITATDSSQTIESWPAIQRRLSLFERTKKKLAREKTKTYTSAYVQVVPEPIKRANVKCLVAVQQGDKGTLARIGPNGLERVESCVNTEKSDSNNGIQCDIALRRARTPKRIISSRKIHFTKDVKESGGGGGSVKSLIGKVNVAGDADKLKVVEDKKPVKSKESKKPSSDVKKDGFVTVLSTRTVDPKASRSENAFNEEPSDIKIIPEDPLHCLNEFLSLEHMLHRLQDEIHGLDKSIRQISNNYTFPTTLTSTPRSSFSSKLKSFESLVSTYQKELDTANEDIHSAYRTYSNSY